MTRMLVVLGLVWNSSAAVTANAAADWSWQQPNADVLPEGDLKWAPQPFVFEHGDSIRYIDFDNGSDTNDGRTRQTPWKHHPWDAAATGHAAECSGIHTYVFKGGVTYRGTLVGAESGKSSHPIRLTRDPAWGDGEALICGSERVTTWFQGSKRPGMPESAKVAYADLDFAPRNVWLVDDDSGKVTRITLARTPNWRVVDEDDVKSEWWAWDNPKSAWGDREKLNGTEVHLGIDTQHITQPAEYYEGAYIWPEYGWVMSTPYPTRVLKCDPERHALLFGGQWGGGAGSYHVPRYARYYLEDKPEYLDTAGEFWFDKRGQQGGRLYIRLPNDADPNKAHIEAARRLNLIDSEEMSHIYISGLTFRFTNTFWDLDAPPTRGKDVDPACIRLLGSGNDLVIANCRFEHVNLPIRMKAAADDSVIDHVVIRDNIMHYTDHGAVTLADGGAWGIEYPKGRLLDVKVLRNDLFQIGRRPTRYGHGHAIEIDCAQTAEIAGNVGYRLYGSGIFVFGGKRSGAKVERPLSRILIHHNKIVDSLLNTNDWGGIETWQGGPAYVFNNLSRNPRGYKTWGEKLQSDKPATSTFGHAYYMDGGYKQYYFNNIAWGKSKDPYGALGNCSAFQEIQGFLATIFNNTAYNFIIGSRRQAPDAGRNKYLGNIWQSLGEMVFRHANPSKAMADPNAADAGKQGSSFHHESNAYARNLFFDVPEKFGVFEPDGRWHASAESFKQGMKRTHTLGDLGHVVEHTPLTAPEKGDFRPTEAAVDQGARVFVPWGLYATVAEWPFYSAGDDATRIMDEHFYLASYYVNREEYRNQPMYPLTAVHVDAADYTAGPLENWIDGVLRLNGRDQYAVLTNAALESVSNRATEEFKNKSYDWVTFDTPETMTPGKPCEVTLHLKGKGLDPKLKLRADLHWARAGGRFGGMNAWGGEAKAISDGGPYVFRFTPNEKPGLSHFIVTVWLTPTGEWSDQKAVARYSVARAASVDKDGYRSPQVQTSNFLLETYFRCSTRQTTGVLLEKMNAAGYSLTVNPAGRVTFRVKAGNASFDITSAAKINDGQWHHVIAEADRAAKTLTLYVDGQHDAVGTGIGTEHSLANDADLFVGGTPAGRCLAGELEFARIALGTLSDAKTTIEELYSWEFDGPALRDWTGNKSADGHRDAGAIERREK